MYTTQTRDGAFAYERSRALWPVGRSLRRLCPLTTSKREEMHAYMFFVIVVRVIFVKLQNVSTSAERILLAYCFSGKRKKIVKSIRR